MTADSGGWHSRHFTRRKNAAAATPSTKQPQEHNQISHYIQIISWFHCRLRVPAWVQVRAVVVTVIVASPRFSQEEDCS